MPSPRQPPAARSRRSRLQSSTVREEGARDPVLPRRAPTARLLARSGIRAIREPIPRFEATAVLRYSGSAVDKPTEEEKFGPNVWLVDEMYRQYIENPKSVGESWREFFEDYRPPPAEPAKPDGVKASETKAPETKAPEPVPQPPEKAGEPAIEGAAPPEGAAPLKGVAAIIAENMERSLGVPTATSVRRIPAKLLEENRRIINRYLAARLGGKVSFTHLIGWAILKGLDARPRMKAVYVEVDGRPHVA